MSNPTSEKDTNPIFEKFINPIFKGIIKNFSFLLYFIVCVVFLLVLSNKYEQYKNDSKELIENSINKFEKDSKIQLSNYYNSLKYIITNENVMSNESFTIEKIVEDTFDEKLESNMELLRETLRDNKEFGINTVSFWLAFLSLSMIIFTILSIYSNNKVIELNRENIAIMEKKLLDINEDSHKIKIDMYVSKARKEEIDGNYDEAINSYNKIMDLCQNNKYKNDTDKTIIEILYARASLYSKKYEHKENDDDFDKSLKDYNSILEKEPNNDKALFGIAWIYTKKYEYESANNNQIINQYFDKAEKYYDKIICNDDVFDSIGWLYYNRYKITFDDEDYEYSCSCYQKALDKTVTDDKYKDIANNILNLYILKYIENSKSFNDIFDIEKIFSNTNNYIKNINTDEFDSIIDKCFKIIKRSDNDSYISKKALYIMYSMCLAMYIKNNNENDLELAITYAENSVQIDNINLDTLKHISALYIYKYIIDRSKNLLYLEKAEHYLLKLEKLLKDDEIIKEVCKYLSCIYKEYTDLDGKNVYNIFNIERNDCEALMNKYLKKSE